jgi:hypothetical protein
MCPAQNHHLWYLAAGNYGPRLAAFESSAGRAVLMGFRISSHLSGSIPERFTHLRRDWAPPCKRLARWWVRIPPATLGNVAPDTGLHGVGACGR